MSKYTKVAVATLVFVGVMIAINLVAKGDLMAAICFPLSVAFLSLTFYIAGQEDAWRDK